MAIYHLSIKIISRGKGKSAVAAAAYRAGEKIVNACDGVTHDYTRKDGVAHTEILLPENVPAEYSDRATLWNAVEQIEKNKNSQLAREIALALPVELSQEENIGLVRAYCQRHFVSAGMCADICIHDKNDGNPHAHVLLTMRPFEQDGSWAAKSRKEYILNDNGERIRLKSGVYKTRKVNAVDWNEQTKAEEWRSGWADICNRALEQNGHAERIDHRSYERQGVEQIPTIHLGVAASAMEKRGIPTERGDINREIAVSNNQLRQIRGRIKKLKSWIYTQPLVGAPTLIETMQGVAAGKNLDSQWKKISNLKTQAKLLIFLQENSITDLSQLAGKVEQLYNAQYELANTIKAEERRISTLNQHLAQVDILKEHSAVHKKYRGLDPKKRSAFREKHANEIAVYESASKYIKEHLNGRDKIPEKDWRDERDKLLAQRFAHVEEYYNLKDDVHSIEILRRGAENIMREEATVQHTRKQEIEL
ncbi:MobA/MobL family protein [Ruminococcaceae bacterium OttesenSCG-928-L11]|nr:MobA/MobL family protein [Ruminococcaceae bacterium OttesenSCG-928-L11]